MSVSWISEISPKRSSSDSQSTTRRETSNKHMCVRSLIKHDDIPPRAGLIGDLVDPAHAAGGTGRSSVDVRHAWTGTCLIETTVHNLRRMQFDVPVAS